MFYINQNGFPHIPYPTNLNTPDSPYATGGTVEYCGCGLCSAMMAVDRVSIHSLGLQEAVDMAIESKANLGFGTDMTILGPVIAGKFGLKYKETNSLSELKKCLQAGAAAVVRVGGDNPETGRPGVFHSVPHYIAAICYDAEANEFCILDPAHALGRYLDHIKAGRVRLEDNIFLYTPAEILHEDTEDTEKRDNFPRYYLFSRH